MKITFTKPACMKSINLVVLLAGLTSLPAQAVESTLFTVNGMVCAFCAQGIEKKLKKMPETAAVFVDLAAKTVIVEARPDMKLPVDQVIVKIKDAGYDVTATQTIAESVEILRKQAESRKQHEGMHHE